ncbi:hypothetical protein Ahy_Scaffold1g107498 isoform B [Arachis hypogaea]|uniref:Uncharacterized protein n=1 Tax=Arachis hypogaea TaxID=3818 RepID=A0A444WW67_ARAHY|nr:hypothetical protein Ahy_Scaffold1g107498 isoform B [Arachis hypogaea]
MKNNGSSGPPFEDSFLLPSTTAIEEGLIGNFTTQITLPPTFNSHYQLPTKPHCFSTLSLLTLLLPLSLSLSLCPCFL